MTSFMRAALPVVRCRWCAWQTWRKFQQNFEGGRRPPTMAEDFAAAGWSLLPEMVASR